MCRKKILLAGDHFIRIDRMLSGLGELADAFEISETSTPFPLEPFRDIAEVREASGSEEQMIDALRGVSICIAHHAPLTARVLEAAEDLELVIVCRGGPVNVNLEEATRRGVAVAFTPARNAVATAEHTIAMMLSALRGIPASDAGLRRGMWKGDYTWQTAGFELEGSTVGLIGYGAIGHIVARILRAYGATVLVYDPFATADAAEGVTQVDLATLLRRSNIVTLHARESKDRSRVLGRAEIAQLQPGSVVVNCARGSLMDYEAVAEALRSGHLFAAAADVFDEEPLPLDSPLLALENFIMTPHIAGGTRQAAEKAVAIAVEELRRFLAKEPLEHCANPEVRLKRDCT